MEEIEDFLRGFSACIAAMKMYSATHPEFIKNADVAYGHLRHILAEKGELVIGFIEDEIIFERRVLFKISLIMKTLIDHAKKKGIDKLYFYHDVRKEDFVYLVSFLLSPTETSNDLDQQLLLAGVQHIKVGRLTAPEEEHKKNDETLSPYERVLRDLSRFYREFAAEAANIASIHKNLQFIVLNIRDKLTGTYDECRSFENSTGYSLDIIQTLNVGILSMTAASKIGFTREELMDTGMASLLYKIGELVKGAGVSSKQYSLQSAKMLLRHKEYFGPLPIVVAFEHEQKTPPMPHIVSMIITICACYDDALRQQGGDKEQARQRVCQFWPHSELVEKFFKIIDTPQTLSKDL